MTEKPKMAEMATVAQNLTRILGSFVELKNKKNEIFSSLIWMKLGILKTTKKT